MNKSHLLGLALAGFFLAGCYHTGLKNQPGVTTTQPEEPRVTEATGEAMQEEEGPTVQYTDSGFTPASISVTAGDSVTFINASSKQMWVASAVHPTHLELPGFDQLKAVGTGESYTYTFAKAGQWRYHNHVSPGDTGVVVVQ